MPAARFLVVGGGSWGTAFANLIAGSGHHVELAMRDPGQVTTMARDRENRRYLPGIALHHGVEPVLLEPARLAGDATMVVLAVPSRSFGVVCSQLAPVLTDDAIVLSLTKGLEPSSGQRLSVVAAELLGCGRDRVCVLSGPNHAEEVARNTPAATVVASHAIALAGRVQELVATPRFRVYANADVVGVELCAAAKNVIAIAAGVGDGLGFGDNAKAALITRGLREMTRLGSAFGADPRTFAGLAGLGDLVATCCSTHSRNRRAGELLATGVAPDALEQRIGMVAEGLSTAPALARVAAAHGLELPITEQVCALLAGEDPNQAVAALMSREPVAEY